MTQVELESSYKIKTKIGSGSFGRVFDAVNSITGEEVAIKIENKKSDHQQLLYEGSMYRCLYEKDLHPEGIPKVYKCTSQSDYNILIMELLGLSLEDLFNICGRKFSLKTVLLLADQMLKRIEYVHRCGLVHRDIKPENFVMGVGKNQDTLYIIDFGLAKHYMKDGKHAECMKGKKLVGTVRYASIHTHQGLSQSRRDDLESIGYVLIYLLKGSLPWQGITAQHKQLRYEKVKAKKIESLVANLCQGVPDEFAQYLNYVKNLKFDETPDYQKLLHLFRNLYIQKGFKEDFEYDWKSKQSDLDTITNDSRHQLELTREEPRVINTHANLNLLVDNRLKKYQKSPSGDKGVKAKACISIFNCFA